MAHVTVIDVARHAGVSKSTVSNVIRGNAVVAPATKMKVEASVRALGYRPNGVARALRERATKVLALVVPDAATRSTPSWPTAWSSGPAGRGSGCSSRTPAA